MIAAGRKQGAMQRSCARLLVLSFTLGTAGCNDFLSGPGLDNDPNKITNLTKPGPLYIGIQRTAARRDNGTSLHYMQQIAGLARGATQEDVYIGGSGTSFDEVYGAGGLLDIHKMQQLARRVSDSLYIGIAKVYEAIDIGYAADVWGDIPYREAADSTNTRPHFDPQMQVYGDIQAQLDSAVNLFLPATGPSNLGGGLDGSELIYGGRDPDALRTVYTAVARSLKARFFMHVAAASQAGVTGAPPAAYDSALKYATSGISSTGDDFLWFYDLSVGEGNPWWSRYLNRDIGPGAAVVEILNRRISEGVEDNQRISFYFTPASDGGYHGYRPAATTVTTSGGIYDGSGPYSGLGAFIDANVSDASFRSPEITYAETELIAAEATWQLNCGGCSPTSVVPAAQPFLDNARRGRRYGATNEGPVVFGDAPGALPATLQNIIEEKFVTMFLHPEVWNDWKRTCLPSLAPALGAASIPGRLSYGLTEINANPNVPAVSSTGVTITSVSLNPNQPAACPALNYTDSSPLAN
jgi:SusD/RagB-like outer membrane lipoprotein